MILTELGINRASDGFYPNIFSYRRKTNLVNAPLAVSALQTAFLAVSHGQASYRHEEIVPDYHTINTRKVKLWKSYLKY